MTSDSEITAISWQMVGSGEATNAMCGDIRSFEDRCPTGLPGHLKKPHKVTCRRVICPECYGGRISLMAHFDLERINVVRREYYIAGVQLDLGELILSPPADTYKQFSDKESYDRLRKKADRIAEECGLIGGFRVVHQFRGRGDLMDRIRKGEVHPPDSWHFHYIGLSIPREINGKFNKSILKSNDLYDRTEWVYKWIGEYTKKGKRRNWYKKVRYELDHAAIFNNGSGRFSQVNSWIGILSRRNVHREATITDEPVRCDVCGCQAHRYLDDMDQGEATYRKTEYAYSVAYSIILRAMIKYKLERGAERFEWLNGIYSFTGARGPWNYHQYENDILT